MPAFSFLCSYSPKHSGQPPQVDHAHFVSQVRCFKTQNLRQSATVTETNYQLSVITVSGFSFSYLSASKPHRSILNNYCKLTMCISSSNCDSLKHRTFDILKQSQRSPCCCINKAQDCVPWPGLFVVIDGIAVIILRVASASVAKYW